jgi:hypothetical protein
MLACSQFKKSMLMKATAHKKSETVFQRVLLSRLLVTAPSPSRSTKESFGEGVSSSGVLLSYTALLTHGVLRMRVMAANISKGSNNTAVCIAWASRAGIIEIEQIRIRIP